MRLLGKDVVMAAPHPPRSPERRMPPRHGRRPGPKHVCELVMVLSLAQMRPVEDRIPGHCDVVLGF